MPAQVLAELANVLLKKLKPRLEPSRVRVQVARVERMFPVLPLTNETVREAVRGVQDHGLSYYDAQIWAAARLAGISTVLSEDFNVGAVIEGVTFLNPLAETFVIDDLR